VPVFGHAERVAKVIVGPGQHCLQAKDLVQPLAGPLAAGRLDRLLGISAAAVFTIAPSSPMERRWDPVEALRTCSTGSGTVVVDFEKALPRARELAGQGTVVVTGSAHTVGDARALISNDTYKE